MVRVYSFSGLHTGIHLGNETYADERLSVLEERLEASIADRQQTLRILGASGLNRVPDRVIATDVTFPNER